MFLKKLRCPIPILWDYLITVYFKRTLLSVFIVAHNCTSFFVKLQPLPSKYFTVNYILNDAKTSNSRKKNEKREEKDFIALYKQLHSIFDLCQKFGICKSTAYNWIREYAPAKRTRGRTITAHDFYQLERENKVLRAENEIFRQSGCSLASPLADKLAAIDRLKSEFTVHMLYKTLDVLKSTYYHHALQSPVKKCRLAKACALPDFRYRSNAAAFS